MALPDFTIEPWELPFCDVATQPTAPAIARVEVRHQNRLQNLLLRAVQGRPHGLTFFRREEDNAPNQVVQDAPLWRALQDAKPTVAVHLKGVFESQRWFRMFTLDSQLNWATVDTAQVSLVLYAHGTQAWSQLTTSTRDAGRFDNLFTCAEIETLPSQDIHRRILNQLEDCSSDCAFALKWAKSSWVERIRPLIRLKNGTLEEMGQVLKWIAWTMCEFPFPAKVTWQIRIEHDTDAHLDDEEYENEALNYQLDIGGRYINPSTSALRLCAIVQKFFDPRYEAAIAQKHKTIEHLLKTSAVFWDFKFSAPTQHEHLEARLQLREWLRDKVSPEEIALLLAPKELQ